MEVLSYALLAVAIGMVAVRDQGLFIGMTALQALLLGVQAAWLGWEHGETALYWAAGLTWAIKGLAIPIFLRGIIRRIRHCGGADGTLTTKLSLLIAVGLTLTAYYVTATLPEAQGPGGQTLPVGVATMLIGVFLMVSRRVAMTQALGLLVMENGLFVATLATTGGLPLLVDVGIFFDVLVGAVIAGLLVHRINNAFESVDTAGLRRLRG